MTRVEGEGGHYGNTKRDAPRPRHSVTVDNVVFLYRWNEREWLKRLSGKDKPCEHGTHDGAVEQVDGEAELAEPSKRFDGESSSHVWADEYGEAEHQGPGAADEARHLYLCRPREGVGEEVLDAR